MDGRLLVEGDGVNWFVRANELSSGNQSLMGYPGTGDLIKELEYVRQKRASHLTNQDVQCGRRGESKVKNWLKKLRNTRKQDPPWESNNFEMYHLYRQSWNNWETSKRALTGRCRSLMTDDLIWSSHLQHSLIWLVGFFLFFFSFFCNVVKLHGDKM